MSDDGGDCGGGDYGGGSDGGYSCDSGGGDVQMTTFDSDYPAETSYSAPEPPETKTEMTYFESDYPAESCNASEPPETNTEMTYFDSSAPADEASYGYGNEVSEMVEGRRVNESYSFYSHTNDWNSNYNNYNGYRPRMTEGVTIRRYRGVNDDCDRQTCTRVSLIALGMFGVVIFFVFIMKQK